MDRARRHTATAFAALVVLVFLGSGPLAAQAHALKPEGPAATAPVPAPPTGVELTASRDSSITITWHTSAGATRYHIYRGTAPGGESSVPIATTTRTHYTDKNLSSTPIYFYRITAVNASGESARTHEEASKTPPPISTGGNVPGVHSGNGKAYYAKDARLAGFDWFQTLMSWFPQVLGSRGSISPDNKAVDMAYATKGSMTFNDVVVPASGLYRVDWRYAFASGFFPGVSNRRMGLSVNHTVITRTESFPITGSFNTYRHSIIRVHLKKGVNSISLFAVSDHGVARIDQMTVTPAR